MFDSLSFIVMTSVLLSLSLYIQQSLKNFNNSGEVGSNVKTFIDNMVLIAIAMVVTTATILLKGTVFDGLFDLHAPSLLLHLVVILLITIILSSILILRRIKLSVRFDIKSNLIIYSIILVALILPLQHFGYLYLAVLLMFVATLGVFIYRIGFIGKMWSNIGLYFMLISGIGLTICSSLSLLFKEPYFNLFNLGITAFAMFGFFIFYVTYFFDELQNYVIELQERDFIIRDKNRAIEHMSLYDSLTGIQNRNAFEEIIVNLSDSRYVGLFNIHGFMNYNKLLGFDRGNLILKDLANALVNVDPDNIQVFRYYSDKFLFVFSTSNTLDTMKLVDNIYSMLRSTNFQGITLSAYTGICDMGNFSLLSDQTEIISALEVASSMAKTYQNSVYEYANTDHMSHNRLIDLELKLKKAIEDKVFEVHYQPQIDIETHIPLSFEALIRWNHDSKYISPSEFIPLAESKGLMSPITRCVIDRVFSDYSKSALLTQKKVSINLSSDQLIEETFVDYVKSKLTFYDIDASYIVFEITETSLFNDVDKVNQTLYRLKALGCQLSLDDFGNGYSSLFRFSKHDIDEIKFDKSFIEDIKNPKTFNTMKKTSELFKTFNMRIVVEGVETKEQIQALNGIEVDLLQGYYFSRPEPLEVLSRTYINKQSKKQAL